MPHARSRKKDVRQNLKRRARNRWRLRNMRMAIREVTRAVARGDASGADEAFRKACAVIDRTAQKGPVHKNQAARRKSRLSKRIKALKQQQAA